MVSDLKIHPQFPYPKNPNTHLWRYMDFMKFLYLLEKSALFMTRTDCFRDPFEGTVTSFDRANREELDVSGLAELLPQLDKLVELQRKRSYVNCWHANEFESAAMWDLYSKSNEGIAIRTTFKALSDSIIDSRSVFIASVEYFDYNKEYTPRDNVFRAMFMKRQSFEHEKEVRIFHGEHANDYGNGKIRPDEPKYKLGFDLSVNLNVLLQEIYVSPNAAAWVYDLVLKVVQRYKIEARVIQSDLYRSPIF